MTKYYDDAKYNAAFDRCVDAMFHLMQKYGNQVLEQQGIEMAADSTERDEDKIQQIISNKTA